MSNPNRTVMAVYLADFCVAELAHSWTRDEDCSCIVCTALEVVAPSRISQSDQDIEKRGAYAVELLARVNDVKMDMPPVKTKTVLWEAICRAWLKLHDLDAARPFAKVLAETGFPNTAVNDTESKEFEKVLVASWRDVNYEYAPPEKLRLILLQMSKDKTHYYPAGRAAAKAFARFATDEVIGLVQSQK